jgi:hypothetical protein
VIFVTFVVYFWYSFVMVRRPSPWVPGAPPPVPPRPRTVQGLGNALAGTLLGALDVPVQAVGGMHRDVISGSPARGQSAGSRAVQDYGQNVGRLWSDFFRPSGGSPSPFLPREFDEAAEAAVGRFGLEGGAASAARGAGFAADLLTGLAVGGAGSKAGQGAGVVADNVNTYRNMPQVNQEFYRNAIMNRLFHGTRGGAFDVNPLGGRVSENLFGANFFMTPSRPLAHSSGYGAGTAHRVSGLGLDDVSRMNVLDLYPGAPSVRDQFPSLADDLAKMGVGPNNISIQGGANITKDAQALFQALNNPTRFRALENADLRPLFREQGIDAIRHQSGRIMGGDGIYEPVYAMFGPQGLRATPAKPTFDQSVENVVSRIGLGAQQAPNQLRALMNRIFRGTPSEYQPSNPTQFGRKRNIVIDDEL